MERWWCLHHSSGTVSPRRYTQTSFRRCAAVVLLVCIHGSSIGMFQRQRHTIVCGGAAPQQYLLPQTIWSVCRGGVNSEFCTICCPEVLKMLSSWCPALRQFINTSAAGVFHPLLEAFCVDIPAIVSRDTCIDKKIDFPSATILDAVHSDRCTILVCAVATTVERCNSHER